MTGIHTQPNNGASVDWLTPPHIIRAIGRFALDPCAHPKQFYRTARNMIAPPDDGLKIKWRGRVWLNPPYGSAIGNWLKKLAEHGDGVALVPARTEVEKWFWPFIWEAADAILFLRGRLRFHLPDRSLRGNSGHASVLVAYGNKNAEAIHSCGIVGRFFYLK